MPNMSDSIPPGNATAFSDIQLPLSKEIPQSTRAVHARVNKLIVARLPLALPPRTTDPGAYATGMLHIAPIYATFEALWQQILDITSEYRDNILLFDRDGVSNIGTDPHPVVDERLHAVLERIYVPGLMRSSRLKADICDMTGWSPQLYDEQLKTVSQTGELADFLAHVKQTIREKPHVLISYSYLMYMGLFAGGRFIRASFENAGVPFWSAVPEPIKPTMQPCEQNAVPIEEREPASMLTPEQLAQLGGKTHTAHAFPLRFLHFGTVADGEDLKREYKEKLFDVEDQLTPEERKEVIQESHAIFERIALIVGQLDKVLQGPDNLGFGSSLPISLLSWLKNPLGSRPRDSVAVTKERRSARTSKYSSGSEASTATDPTTITNLTPPKGHPNIVLDDDDEPMGIELCPGIPKSMRFSKSLPIPPRTTSGGQAGASTSVGSLKMKSQGLYDAVAAGVAGWAMFAVLGLMLLGAYFSVLPGTMKITA